jgi:hypothetical protein
VTEAAWLTCTDPQQFPYELLRAFSDRKMRLIAVGCCRLIWDRLCDAGRKAAEVAEAYAEGRAGKDECDHAQGAVRVLLPSGNRCSPYGAVAWTLERGYVACQAAHMAAYNIRESTPIPLATLADLFRCVTGNPFNRFVLDPQSRSSAVLSLAESIYADRAFDRLPILADALQDAGCDDEQLLAHCRSGGPHVRGCWAVDLVLGKS